MPETRINTYEVMFLFPQAASGDLQSAVDHIDELLRRCGAEILAMSKWDERRLAYEIKGNKRGIYFHAYIRADASKMIGFERDCNLSEQLLRFMVLRADNVLPEAITAAEGREKLADEIKLRRERPAEAAAAAVTVTAGGGDEDEDDVVVADIDDDDSAE